MTDFKPNMAAAMPAAGKPLEITELPLPEVKPDEILVENKSIAMEHMDWKRQAFGFMIPSYPAVLGSDIAGIVVKVGSEVTAFKTGDRVTGMSHGMLSGKTDNGAFQTYTAVKAALSSKLPDNITFNQAVTVGTSSIVASSGLFENLNLPRSSLLGGADAKETEPKLLLIWGAASSMGSMAVQLARLSNVTVLATASPAHHERLHGLGASFVADYRSPTVVKDLVAAAAEFAKTTGAAPLSVAMDTIGTAETLRATEEVLKLAAGEGATKLAHLPQLPKDLKIGGGNMVVEQVRGDKAFMNPQAVATTLYHNALPTWLAKEEIVPSGFKVMEGGLGGIQDALNALKKGGSAEKLIVEL